MALSAQDAIHQKSYQEPTAWILPVTEISTSATEVVKTA